MTISELYQQFTKERQYLQNVAPKTLEWYACTFRHFRTHLTCDVRELYAHSSGGE